MYQNKQLHSPTPSAKLAIMLVCHKEGGARHNAVQWLDNSQIMMEQVQWFTSISQLNPRVRFLAQPQTCREPRLHSGLMCKNCAGVFGRRRLIRYGRNKVFSEQWWADNKPGNLGVITVNAFQITETAHPLRSASKDKCIDQGVFKAPPTTPR